jgi:hypothetical protein
VDLGPLVGWKRGLKTRECIPFSGVEMEVEPTAGEAEKRGRSGGVNGRMKPNGFINRQKTPPPPLPNILSSGSPTPTPTSPSLRRKGKGKAVEGDGDVEMLDGDEDLRPGGRSTRLKCSLYSFSCFYFCDFTIRISKRLLIFLPQLITHHHLQKFLSSLINPRR